METIKNGINRRGRKNTAGFSLVELLIVVTILLLLVGLAIPQLMAGVHSSRLRNAGTDFSGLLQQMRMRAIQDDRYYSVYQHTSANNLVEEFVDIYPQNVNGASGSGGATVNAQDPLITLATEVVQQPQGAAPNTSNLSNQVLGANPSGLVPQDGTAQATPITFGPQGLPCLPVAVAGGTVCNSRGGPVVYWVFFQNSVTKMWEAVTVTPAGRVQKWFYSGGVWSKL